MNKESTPMVEARPLLSRADLDLLRTLPGVSQIALGQLVAHTSDCLAQQDRAAMRVRTGVAAVTVQSGGRSEVRTRAAESRYLRDTVHHMASTAVLHNSASRMYYNSLRNRGCHHGRALRTVADRQWTILFAMLREGNEFDANAPTRWQDTAQRSDAKAEIDES